MRWSTDPLPSKTVENYDNLKIQPFKVLVNGLKIIEHNIYWRKSNLVRTENLWYSDLPFPSALNIRAVFLGRVDVSNSHPVPSHLTLVCPGSGASFLCSAPNLWDRGSTFNVVPLRILGLWSLLPQLVRQRFHAGRGKLRRPEAVIPDLHWLLRS